MSVGLAYTDARGRIFFDEDREPLADDGVIRLPQRDELIRAPQGTVTTMLPGRTPLLARGTARGETALGVLLPAGFTRTLLPAYKRAAKAPTLPLFGYTFAAVVDDELQVAAMRTDESEDWQPRSFAPGELEAAIARRQGLDPANRTLAQVAHCARDYGCFTAQNVFLGAGEAALPVSPACNARCVGCISELDEDAGFPSPQTRIAYEATAAEVARIAVAHLAGAPGAIVSFGQGCEGEPLLRATTIARAVELIRAAGAGGVVNCNTNGSLPRSLSTLIALTKPSTRWPCSKAADAAATPCGAAASAPRPRT